MDRERTRCQEVLSASKYGVEGRPVKAVDEAMPPYAEDGPHPDMLKARCLFLEW